MPDAASWRSIAEALASSQCPDSIRRAIDGNPTSADVVRGLTATWPRGEAAISGLEVIPVAVDTHVQRVTEMLGLAEPRNLDDSHRARIQAIWFEAVAQAGSFGAPDGIEGTAAGLDPALWALGKEGCSRCEKSARKIPVGSICDPCVLGRVEGQSVGRIARAVDPW